MLLRNWTDIPLLDFEVFASRKPSFMLRQEPDFCLHHFSGIDLVKVLESSSVSNVKVEDVIGAENTVDGVSALRPKRVQALR